MANIKSMDIKNGEIFLNLKVSKTEYDTLRQSTDNLILLPTDVKALNNTLTTGKLGNSNRLMLPKKILEKNSIFQLQKKVPAKIFRIGGEVFLLVKLEESKIGIPFFKEDEAK
jgi:hypothetical protein